MLHATLAILALQTSNLTLSRGGSGDASFRYWNVEDTFIEQNRPDSNFGRDLLLSGGPQKTILIRFADLARMVGPNKRIERARLILNQEIGAVPNVVQVSRLTAPWGEGSGRRGVGLFEVPLEPGAKSPALAATWKSRLGGLGAQNWDADGALGLKDREALQGVSIIGEDGSVILDGLGPAIQRMLQDPKNNFGLALNFESGCDFTSSDSPYGRPRLQLELADAVVARHDISVVALERTSGDFRDGARQEMVALIGYQGDEASGPFRGQIMVDGRTVTFQGENLKPGEIFRAPFQMSWRTSGDLRRHTVEVSVESNKTDSNPANNAINIPTASVPVNLKLNPEDVNEAMPAMVKAGFSNPIFWGSAVAGTFNEVLLRNSRFSFATQGAKARLRFEGVTIDPAAPRIGLKAILESPDWLRKSARALGLQAGLLDLSGSQVKPSDLTGQRSHMDPYPGLMGGGDSRDDLGFPGVMGFPVEPWLDAAVQQLQTVPSDLLSATDVAILNFKAEKPDGSVSELIPAAINVRVLDGVNQLVKGAKLEMKALPSGELIQSVEALGGVAPILNFAKGATTSTATVVKITRAKDVEYAFIKTWQLIDAFARGNFDSCIIPVRAAMPYGPLDWSSNLAEGRLVTDDLGSLPTSLAALTDGNPKTTFTWNQKSKGVIEIDLQKDRLIGEISVEVPTDGAIWPKFRVLSYQTGSPSNRAIPWLAEVDGTWMLANRGDSTENGRIIRYRGPIIQARYIKLEIPATTTECKISEIRVHPVIVNGQTP
jgi:hypothetical protein